MVNKPKARDTGPDLWHGMSWAAPRARLVLVYVAVIHLAWAALLAVDGAAVNTTTLHGFASLKPGVTAVVFAVAGVLSLWATFARAPLSSRLAAMIPAQLVLFVCGAAAGAAMLHSRFGDGVRRPRAFITADQLPAVLIIPIHAAAIVLTFGGARRPA